MLIHASAPIMQKSGAQGNADLCALAGENGQD
jgi:hypothetical protein